MPGLDLSVSRRSVRLGISDMRSETLGLSVTQQYCDQIVAAQLPPRVASAVQRLSPTFLWASDPGCRRSGQEKAAIWSDGPADCGGVCTSGAADPQIGGDSVVKKAGEGKVREESDRRRAVPNLGSTERVRTPPSGCRAERLRVGTAIEAPVNTVRCILMASRETNMMEIPSSTQVQGGRIWIRVFDYSQSYFSRL